MNKLVKAITVFGLTAAMALPFAACGEGGKSAYDIAVDNGFVGTEEEWLESLVGPQGPQGEPGQDGEDGQDGAPGADGTDGATPTIEINEDGYWVINGVVTDVKAEGQDGQDGAPGQDGQDGQDGEDGKDGQDGEDGKDGQDGQDGEDGKDGQDGEDGKDGEDGAPGVGIENITSAIKTENGTSYTVITIELTDGTEYVFNLPGVATTPGASYETGDANVFAELYNAGAGKITLAEDVALTDETLNAVTGNITIDLAGKTLNLGDEALKTSGVGTITVTGAGKIVGQDPSLGINGQGTLLDDDYVSVAGDVTVAEEEEEEEEGAAAAPAVLAETSETTYTIFAKADLPAEYTVIAGTAAFKTLDEAITAINAHPNAYTNEDELIVTIRDDQTLSAAVTLSRDDMTIAGETADTKVAVALNGEGEQAGIYINANNITISDLALTLTGGNGNTAVIKPLWAEDGAQVADLKLSNLTITGNDVGHGVNLHNVKDAVVENCTISSYGKNGIAIASATGVTINGVTFKDTTAWADIGLMYAGSDNKTTTTTAGTWYKTPVTGVKIGDNTYAIGNLYSDITHAFAVKVYGAEVADDAYDFTFTGAYDFNKIVYVKAGKSDVQQNYVTDAVLEALVYEAKIGDTYYAQLEDALEDVNADTSASPVTVQIAAGEYTLSAYTISRANVTFEGAGVYTAAVTDGSGATTTPAAGTKLTFTAQDGDQAGLYIAANDVTISGMTVAVTGGDGNTGAIKPVWAEKQVENLTLSNLTIIGNEQGHGVNLHNVKSAVVENCTIENYKKVGIAVASATGVTITGVKFTVATAWGDIGLMYADNENGTSGTTPGDWYKTPVTGVALGAGNVFAAKLLYSDITPDFAKTVYGNKTGIYDISGMSAYDLDPIIFHKADGSVQKWYVDADVLAAKKPAAAIGNHYYETLEAALDDLEEGDTLTLMAGEYDSITLPDLADLTVVGAGAANTVVKGGIWFGYNLTNTADKHDDQVSWALRNLTVDGDYTSDNAAIVGVNSNVHVAGVGSTFALSNVVIKNAKWGFQVASDAKNIAVTLNKVEFETLGCAISMKTGENDDNNTKNGNTYSVTNCTFTDVDYQLQEFYPNNYYETIGGEATVGSRVTVTAPTAPTEDTSGGSSEE